MTDKEIEIELNEMALREPWGTVERINGIPQNIAIIQETLDYINRLKTEKKQVRKETAKEILEYFNNSKMPFFVDYDELCQKYGIEDLI